MDITYRPARLDDLDTAMRIVQEVYNDLRVRHGLPPTVPLRPPAFQRFCLEKDPDGLWVAESGDALLGFGFAWMRERFWYLAQLFVRPGTQAAGIGQALLSKTLQLAERSGTENRALITMAYNTASTGLYIRNGLYPREPLLRLGAPVQTIKASRAGLGCDQEPIRPWPECRGWLERIDEEVLGFRREEHHAFLLDSAGIRGVRLECAGRVAGYAYVSAEGHIGPLAVAPGADLKEVVSAAIRCALDGTSKQVSMIVPGRADRMLVAALEFGFRVEEPLVLLSARPVGDWGHYLPGNPAFM
jgi:ribosomal protein S18 acetylase RimI-like enzyme